MSQYLISFDEMMQDQYGWSLVDNEVFSINNMSDREIRESIIEDLLVVTVYEIREKTEVRYTQWSLVRWLPFYKRSSILKMVDHCEIANLIERSEGKIRIRNDRNILRAAMEYCGVYYEEWFDKEELPKDLIGLNSQVVEELIEANGSFDNMVKSLAMGLEANCSTQNTLN